MIIEHHRTATQAAGPTRQLLERLRSATAGTNDEALTEALRDAVLALVRGVLTTHSSYE